MFTLNQLVSFGTFHLLAGLITLTSLMVVCARHPVKSAVFLVIDLFLLAAMYATLDAHFIAAIQVLVYAGAIVVLFLFVIMLLSLQSDAMRAFKFSAPEAGGLIVILIGFAILGFNLVSSSQTGLGDAQFSLDAIENNGGNTRVLAMRLMTQFIWPFEIASVLILLAIVASIIIAKKDTVEKLLSQKNGGEKSAGGVD